MYPHRSSVIAHYAHYGQKYAGGPYTDHLEAVAEMVCDISKPSEDLSSLVCVAWLHDILEDTRTTKEDLISEGFSQEVVDAVVAITKEKGYDYSAYISRIRTNNLALRVKKADTLCNLTQSVKEGSPRRIKKYTKQLQLLCEE